MDWVNNFLSLGVAGLIAVVLLAGLVVAFPSWLYHRREAMRIKGTHAKEWQKLRDRIETLEKRCAKLDEHVSSAHILLADERRSMDKKLSNIMPDSAALVGDDEDDSERAPRRKKSRNRDQG